MLKAIRNSKISTFFIGLISCCILNCSVDFVVYPANKPGSSTIINEQDTVLEMLLEQTLGFENAIPESENDDSDPTTLLKKNNNVDFFYRSFCKQEKGADLFKKERPRLREIDKLIPPFAEIFSPPPEA